MSEDHPECIQIDLPAVGGPLPARFAAPRVSHTLVIVASEQQAQDRRENHLAAVLNHAGCATLTLTPPAGSAERNRFSPIEPENNIQLLAQRIQAAADWAGHRTETQGLPVVLVGTGTTAAACLRLAAQHPQAVLAVVARSPRTDLVEEALPRVNCPVLLAVGENNPIRLNLAEEAARRLRSKHRLAVFAGVGLHFTEAEAWETYATLTANWLLLEAPYRSPQAADSRRSLILLGTHPESLRATDRHQLQDRQSQDHQLQDEAVHDHGFRDWKRWTRPVQARDSAHSRDGPEPGAGGRSS